MEYYSINPDEGINYAEKGLELSKRINWRKGEAKCLRALATIYSFGKSDFTKAMHYSLEALKINEEMDDKDEMITNYSGIARIYSAKSKFMEAHKYYSKAFQLSDEIGNDQYKGTILVNIGTIHGRLALYLRALEYFYQSLEINKKLNNKTGIAGAYLNIGNIYKALMNSGDADFQKNADKAVEYYSLAVGIFSDEDNQLGSAVVYRNIGVIFQELKKYESALEYYRKAVQIFNDFDNQYDKSATLSNIANTYKDKGMYDSAAYYYKTVLDNSKEIDDKISYANYSANLGALYLSIVVDEKFDYSSYASELIYNSKIENLEKAKYYLIEAVQIFEQVESIHELSDFLLVLGRVYELLGNNKQSSATYRKYIEIKDSISIIETKSLIMNKEIGIEIDKLDYENTILKHKQENQRLQIFILLVGVFLLMVAAFFNFVRYMEKKKVNIRLEEKNKLIAYQKSLTDEQHEQIMSSVRYASTIQHTIMPWENTLRSAFGEILTFYKPKDIVSGDCYWFQEVEGIKFLAVVDCTGHGIPGAMLTVVASTVLDIAVMSKKLQNTADILNFMNEKVTQVLNQKIEGNNSHDGMEVALVAITPEKIRFSGAGRCLYLCKQNIEIIKTDSRGIAGSKADAEYKYSYHDITIDEPMTIYLCSDGFADQMNENSKKYSVKRLIKLLDKIHQKPFSEQADILENEFIDHRGNREQIDDITIVSIRL